MKISIGPAIEDGFYYDFEFPDGTRRLRGRLPGDRRADARARQGRARPSSARTCPSAQARERFLAERQDYKVELIDDLVSARRTPARSRCETRLAVHQRPLHRPLPRPARAQHRRRVGAFKLQSVAGAYWRGDSTAHDAHAHLRHRVLLQGRARGAPRAPRAGQGARPPQARARARACSRSPSSRPAAAFWMPAGHERLERARRRCRARRTAERGYSEVKTPQILYDAELWKHVRALGQVPREHVLHRGRGPRRWALKPMNCPGHAILFYKDARHSYRDLPVRYSEPGLLHRNEPSRRAARAAARAPLHPGRRAHLLHRGAGRRTRSCGCLRFGLRHLRAVRLRVAPGALDAPREAHRQRRDVGPRRGGARRRARRELGLEYELNPGDGAFYGPKIDMHMTDSLGRSWQLGTVQLDYSMPERFELTYTGADNARAPPGDDPPRAVRLLRALHRDPARALRRRAAAVAGAGAGDRAAGLRPLQRLRRARSRDALRGARRCASSSTSAASRSGARSARPSCARSPTCWSSASARQGERHASSVREHRGGEHRRASRERRASCASRQRRSFARARSARRSYTRPPLKPAPILRAPRIASA